MRYEQILANLSPKVLLDHYWEILDLIDWRLSFSTSSQEFTIDEIMTALSRDLNIDNPYYRRKLIRVQKVLEDVISRLFNAGLIEKKDDNLVKTEEYSKFFNFLKKNVKGSVIRVVSWAVWRLYSRGLASFKTSQLLDELSYSDEDYREELNYLWIWKDDKWYPILERKEGNIWQLVNEPYRPHRPILISELPERIKVAILELSKSEFSDNEIIQKIRELEEKAVERILRRLKLEFRDGLWHVNDIAIAKIRENLKGKISLYWPFFGIAYVKGNPYFKILRGSSCTAYVDVPNEIIREFIDYLIAVSTECKNKEEFYFKACKVAEYYNRSLRKEAKELFGKNISWLSFKIMRIPFMDKYGVKIAIQWREFLRFLEEYSKAEIELWKKYRYISYCRHSSLNLVLRKELERTQEEVKEVSKDDRIEISREFNNLIDYLMHTKDKLMRIQRDIQRKTQTKPILLTLLYLPEMTSTLNALTSFINNGVIPACYREMRKIIENLAWALFDDILIFRCLRVNPQVEWLPRPYFDISKEWYDAIKHIKQAQPKSKLTVNNLGALKKKIKKLIESTSYRGNKKSLADAIFKNVSYSSFIILLGEDASNIGKKKEEFIPKYDSSHLLPIAKEDFKEAIESLNIANAESLTNEIMEILEKEVPPTIVPPYPSNEFVLGFVDKTFSTSLQKKYSEYSFFVHSYFTSWHIFPFSSVLEFKVFKHELKKFSNEIQNLLTSFSKLLSQIKTHI